jgi:hypothetical protein
MPKPKTLLARAAAAAGYKTIEIQMGAGLLPKDIANSTRTKSSTRTIRINSDATGPGNRFAHPRYDVLTRRQGLTRRANHLHMFNIKNLKPAPGNWSRAF